ncbi:hypothetical protein PFISCL1PPCAC_27871, partial [Pristionchus fissidentatus]
QDETTVFMTPGATGETQQPQEKDEFAPLNRRVKGTTAVAAAAAAEAPRQTASAQINGDEAPCTIKAAANNTALENMECLLKKSPIKAEILECIEKGESVDKNPVLREEVVRALGTHILEKCEWDPSLVELSRITDQFLKPFHASFNCKKYYENFDSWIRRYIEVQRTQKDRVRKASNKRRRVLSSNGSFKSSKKEETDIAFLLLELSECKEEEEERIKRLLDQTRKYRVQFLRTSDIRTTFDSLPLVSLSPATMCGDFLGTFPRTRLLNSTWASKLTDLAKDILGEEAVQSVISPAAFPDTRPLYLLAAVLNKHFGMGPEDKGTTRIENVYQNNPDAIPPNDVIAILDESEYVQPLIFTTGSSDNYYLSLSGRHCRVGPSFLDALNTLISVYYLFNAEYNEFATNLMKVLEYLMNICTIETYPNLKPILSRIDRD